MNILKYERIEICNCDMCKNPDTDKSILRRIIYCNCQYCEKSDIIIYLKCVQLHFLYFFSHNLDIVNNTIDIIKKEYKRKKRLIILYSRFIGKILKIYIEVKYRPFNSGYWEAYNNFLSYC